MGLLKRAVVAIESVAKELKRQNDEKLSFDNYDLLLKRQALEIVKHWASATVDIDAYNIARKAEFVRKKKSLGLPVSAIEAYDLETYECIEKVKAQERADFEQGIAELKKEEEAKAAVKKEEGEGC